MDRLEGRIAEGRSVVKRLLTAELNGFAKWLRAALPVRPGLYAITERAAESGVVLRAGRAKGQGGLRQDLHKPFHRQSGRQPAIATRTRRDL